MAELLQPEIEPKMEKKCLFPGWYQASQAMIELPRTSQKERQRKKLSIASIFVALEFVVPLQFEGRNVLSIYCIKI